MSEQAPLDQLCSRETAAEIVALLDPIDTLIAYLRARGWPDAQIGAELGLSRQSVWERMNAARQRIAAALPELRVVLDGRRHVGRPAAADPDAPLTVAELARRVGVQRGTIVAWIHAGHLPGAYRQGKRFLVPRATAASLQPPRSSRRRDLAQWEEG